MHYRPTKQFLIFNSLMSSVEQSYNKVKGSKGSAIKGKRAKSAKCSSSVKTDKSLKEAASKSPSLQPSQPRTSSIIKCFALQRSKATKATSVTSPEYKMSQPQQQPRQTRRTSKKDQNELQPEGDNDPEKQQIYNAVLPCPIPICKEEFADLPQEKQMGNILSIINSLCNKVTEIDVSINHDSDGIQTKLVTAQTQNDTNTSDIATLKKDLIAANADIGHVIRENSILKSVLHKHGCNLKSMNDKVAMLTAKSMERNITISGLEGEHNKENCKEKVIKFLKEKVEIDVNDNEVLVAHCIGQKRKTSDKPRLMIARCTYELKERVFKNVSNLKDKTNNSGDYFYINKQLPDKIAEQNREIREIIKEQKIKDQSLQPRDRSKIEVIKKVVHIDGQPITKQILPIEVDELFPDHLERDKQDKMKLSSSDTITESESTFAAYAYKTGQIHEVRRAYRKVRRLHPGAAHVIAAYNLRGNRGFQDDEEYSAGSKALKLLEQDSPINIAVFIVRTYGGTHIGPKRFDHILEVAKQAIDRLLTA